MKFKSENDTMALIKRLFLHEQQRSENRTNSPTQGDTIKDLNLHLDNAVSYITSPNSSQSKATLYGVSAATPVAINNHILVNTLNSMSDNYNPCSGAYADLNVLDLEDEYLRAFVGMTPSVSTHETQTSMQSVGLFMVMTYAHGLEIVLTMKWYVMTPVSNGFSCLLSKSYGLIIILSFSNDLFYFTMPEFNKFLFLLCGLNTTDWFDCTYIYTIFTTFIDLIPHRIGILKSFESAPSVATANVLHPKPRGVPVPAHVTIAQAKNSRVDVPCRRTVGAASLGHTISVVCLPSFHIEQEVVSKRKKNGGFVVAQLMLSCCLSWCQVSCLCCVVCFVGVDLCVFASFLSLLLLLSFYFVLFYLWCT